MSIINQEVLNAIQSERAYQDNKWPGHQHTVGEWVLIMDKCQADARRAWVNGHGNNDALHEIRQVVTVGIRALEAHGAPLRMVPGLPAPATGMSTEKKLQIAWDAINHVLSRIADDEGVRYHLGAATTCFDKLSAAYAAINEEDLVMVRESFIPGTGTLKHKPLADY